MTLNAGTPKDAQQPGMASGVLGPTGREPVPALSGESRPHWKHVCEFCGRPYINRGFHMENVCAGRGYMDPKPAKRIVDGTAMPLDSEPIDENFCPTCQRTVFVWERAHVVGRGVRGDDVPENMAWLCSDCHRSLHRDGPSSDVAIAFVRYCRKTVPELGAYADAKKYRGYIERRYLGA